MVCKNLRIRKKIVKNKKVREIPFERSFASHPRSKDWSVENEIQPEDVYKSSHKKYFFYCNICKHNYKTSLHSITNSNSQCPYCYKQLLCDEPTCQFCEKKSFVHHPMAKCWSNVNKENPRNVYKSSTKKYFFNCDICNHVYETMLNSIIYNDSGCPFCANLRLCDKNDCKLCFNKSFDSHPRKNNWSKINDIAPRDVFKNTHKKYFFDCDICNHVYQLTLNKITSCDVKCNYCNGNNLCNNNDCNFCREKSFILNPKVKYWSDKNTLLPQNICKSSDKKILFDCPDCNETYESRLADVTHGSWCPCTKNKTENKLFNFLFLYNNYIVIRMVLLHQS